MKRSGQWDDPLHQGFGRFDALSYWHVKWVRRAINGRLLCVQRCSVAALGSNVTEDSTKPLSHGEHNGLARCLFGDGLYWRVFIRDMLIHGDARAGRCAFQRPSSRRVLL